MPLQVVVLSSRFPYPLTKGDKLRLYYQMVEMAKHVDIHLICINDKIPSADDMSVVQEFCQSLKIYLLEERNRKINLIRHCSSNMPMQVRYFYDQAIHKDLIREVEHLKPDYIFTQLVRMAPYVQGLDKNITRGLDFMDSMTLNDLAGQYLSSPLLLFIRNRERRLIQSYESEVANRFNDLFIISARDRAKFSEAIRGRIEIASNGVVERKAEPRKTEKFDIVFCGNLSYEPNRQAARYLCNQIMPRLPRRTCLIAGAEPGNLKKELASENVEIRGFQSDMKRIYQSGKMMVVPIFMGSGQQNKVLEAMSYGTPCVVSSFVDEALVAQEGKDLLVADDANTFIEHINSLILHPDKRRAISRSALSVIKEHYSWSLNTMPLIKRIKEGSKG